MRHDKQQSKRRKRRVPEKIMLIVAIIGGALGVFLGMLLFHHKTKKVKFTLGIPTLILTNLIIVYFIITQLTL